MCLDLCRSIQTKPCTRFSLQQFVTEVTSFDAPIHWNLVSAYAHLLGQYLVSNFLAALAAVGSESEDAFEYDHAECEIVDCDTVVLPAHDFRSHVAWCARGVFLVFGSPYSGDTEICDAQVAV